MYYDPIKAGGHPCPSVGVSISSRGIIFRLVFLLAGCLAGSLAWSQQWTTATNGVDIYSSLSGNVGIGTTTPQAKLDVKGLYFLNRPSALVDNLSTLGIAAGSYLGIAPTDLSSTNDSYMLLNFPDNNSFRIGTNYDGHVGSPKYRDIQFGRYVGDAYMTIKDGGNVCIGTTDPKGYKLAVNGAAIFTQAVVKLNGNWPDYVFHPDYPLQPLGSVAQYIRDHQHLPEVPSADSIQKNGIDLGSTQTVLLKKIEELTLYAIQQEQKVKEQDQRLKQQEQEIGLLQQLNKKLEAQQEKIDQLERRMDGKR